MKPQRIPEGATYDPPTLKAMFQAFDEAWAGIADMHSYPAEIERARVRLAKSVLAVVSLHGTDVQALRDAALVHFALNYRDRPDDDVHTARSREDLDGVSASARDAPQR